ncbi:MAG: sigma-70 family RNA polymerase sigma factor [Myxococcales bacterium]
MIGERNDRQNESDLFLKDPLTSDKSSVEVGGRVESPRKPQEPTALSVPAAGETPATTASVYAQWAKFVWLSLQRLGVRRADLDDVCHDVFIVVQRKLPEFDQRAKLQTWLFGICTRVAANYRRRAYIRYEDLAGGIGADGAIAVAAPEASRPDQQVARQRSLSQAEGILNRMSPVKRTVFVMFELEGLNCPEIAAELGLPVGTVYSRLHSARQFFLAESTRAQNGIKQ